MSNELTQPDIQIPVKKEDQKKILIISGSPRKRGNTIHIVNILVEKMKSLNQNLVFDYLFLKDKDLKFCMGCMNCLKKGRDGCPIKDDKMDILAEMHTADGIIFACPGYSHQVTAMFKNFLDRFMFLDHLPEFIGTPVVIISTVDYDGADVIPKYIADMNILWWGCNIIGKIGVAHALFELNNRYHDKIIQKLDVISKDFNTALYEISLKSPSLYQYVSFTLNKFETEFAAQAFPERYQHWKKNGWLEKSYFYDTKIKFSHVILSRIILAFVRYQVKRDLGKDYQTRIMEYYKK